MFLSFLHSIPTAINRGKVCLRIAAFVAVAATVLSPGSVFALHGRIVTEQFTSPSLALNQAGDSAEREVSIYLPPTYDASDKQYPVVYLLHGLTPEGNTMWVPWIADSLDVRIEKGEMNEVIVVMPDAIRRPTPEKYYGSYYTNSEFYGYYEDYIARDLVPFIDGKYRTIPGRDYRAIGGHSMGGYGATKIAFKNTDVFGAVAALNPADIVDSKAYGPTDLFSGFPEVLVFYSQLFSSNLDNPPTFADIPVDSTGNLIESVWQRWLESSTSALAEERLSEVLTLEAIYIDIGLLDPWHDYYVKDFHQTLIDLGIPHIYKTYMEGHLYELRERSCEAVAFLSGIVAPTAYVLTDTKGTPPGAAATTPVTFTVRVEQAPPEGQLKHLTIDLRPIGGDSHAKMYDDGTHGDEVIGDGIFTAQAFIGEETPIGRLYVWITLEDSFSWKTRLPVFLEVFPSENRYIYQDEVAPEWELEVFGAESDLMASEYVHSGDYSHAITFKYPGNVRYRCPDGFSPSGYILEFWINPGQPSIEDLYLILKGTAGEDYLKLVDELGIVFEPGVWRKVSVPLEECESIEYIGFRIIGMQDAKKTFYIDDVKWAAKKIAVTAVEELASETAVPVGYSLSQNFPNPFNAETVIVFQLPFETQVSLKVYDLLGREVRTLVDGALRAGFGKAFWDGKDAKGGDAGSGMYFYRLKAGRFVETKRMVLLK